MDISVVIPLYNEDESLPELYAWIERVMKSKGFTFEVVFVNDGSTDNSWNVIQELGKNHPERGSQCGVSQRDRPQGLQGPEED